MHRCRKRFAGTIVAGSAIAGNRRTGNGKFTYIIHPSICLQPTQTNTSAMMRNTRENINRKRLFRHLLLIIDCCCLSFAAADKLMESLKVKFRNEFFGTWSSFNYWSSFHLLILFAKRPSRPIHYAQQAQPFIDQFRTKRLR